MPKYSPYKPLTQQQERLAGYLEGFNSMTAAQAAGAIKKYAKAANQRLRRLEQAGFTAASSAYRWAERQSYDERQFMDKTQAGEIKFKTTTKGRTLQEMKQELANLYTFLYEAKTSTVEGTRMRYEKQFETFKERWKASEGSEPSISFDDFGYMWQMTGVQRIIEIYGSKEVVRLVQKARADGLSWQEIDEVFTDAYEGGFSVRWTRRTFDEINKQHLESITEQRGLDDLTNYI